MLKVCFATDLKPPLDEIDDKVNFNLSTFTEITYPDDKTFKTPVIHNSSFPIWNHWIDHKFKITKDQLKPLIFKIKTKNKSDIGNVVININDLLEAEGEYHIQGSYKLKSSDNDFTGSILYLQGVYVNSQSNTNVQSLKTNVPQPTFDIHKYLEENRHMGMLVIKFISFDVPKTIADKNMDLYLRIKMPGGGEQVTQYSKSMGFGYLGDLVLDRVSISKNKSDAIRIWLQEYATG